MTVEEYAVTEDPPGCTTELVAGELYTLPLPGLRHGECVGEVAWRVNEHVRANKLGRCSLRNGLVAARNPDTVLAPDVQFWRLPPAERKGWPTTPPALVAEVVDGPLDYKHALLKVPYLFAFGVEVVWIMGCATKTVQAHRLADHPTPFDPWEWRSAGYDRFRGIGLSGTLDGGEVLPGFACSVADLFA
jgi:Uma2 family endonuclease